LHTPDERFKTNSRGKGIQQDQEDTMGPLAKEIEVNRVRLSYVEQGSGEPIVFVHGAFSDLRVWEPVREEVARRYRFIAYTQRYHGVGAWKDDGKEYSTATHANDLAKFITSLNVGSVLLRSIR
jgi:pimeloyl-ACP methyl ester carboxylesterase